jgi:hypothetical protein
MRKALTAGLIALTLAITPLPAAPDDDPNTVSGDKGTDMLVDIVVVRPLGLAATVIGTALTIVALPFTIPTGSVAASVHEMIVKPAQYTFQRPLGQFDDHPD